MIKWWGLNQQQQPQQQDSKQQQPTRAAMEEATTVGTGMKAAKVEAMEVAVNLRVLLAMMAPFMTLK